MNNAFDLSFMETITGARPARRAPTLSQGHYGFQTPGVSPGSYWCDLDAVDYHTKAAGESASRIKHMLVSPGHYQLKLQRPTIETDALRLGRMLHTTVLEPHLVSEEFAIWTDGRRQGALWEVFKISNSEKTIITQDQEDCALGMARALHAVDDFPLKSWLDGIPGNQIAPAIKERCLFWIDEETGLLCKARPDAMTLGQSALTGDLKSTRSCDPEEFKRDVFKFRYDLQAAHYVAGIKAVYGDDPKFAFFAVEKEAPHVTRTFVMTPEALAYGERYRRYCLRMIKKCRDENRWPKQPPPGSLEPIDPPFFQDKQFLDMAKAYGIEV
jgi:hypothetical protein